MQLDKLSIEFERALENARHFAERRDDAFIAPVHLLHVVFENHGALAAIAEKQRLDRGALLDLLATRAAEERTSKLAPGKQPVAGKALRQVIEQAFNVAERRG